MEFALAVDSFLSKRSFTKKEKVVFINRRIWKVTAGWARLGWAGLVRDGLVRAGLVLAGQSEAGLD